MVDNPIDQQLNDPNNTEVQNFLSENAPDAQPTVPKEELKNVPAPDVPVAKEQDTDLVPEKTESDVDPNAPQQPVGEADKLLEQFAPDQKPVQEPTPIEQPTISVEDQKAKYNAGAQNLDQIMSKVNPSEVDKKIAEYDDSDGIAAYGQQGWETIKYWSDKLFAPFADTAYQASHGLASATVQTGKSLVELGQLADKINPLTYIFDEIGLGVDKTELNKHGTESFNKLQQAVDEHYGAPQTASGEIAKSLSQFAVGMFGAGKLMSGVNAIVKTPAILNSMTTMGLAEALAFDEHADRLSNTLESVPGLKSIVTKLTAKPDDTFWGGKLKQFVEGAALAGTAEAVSRAIMATIKLAPFGWKGGTAGAKLEPNTSVDLAEWMNRYEPQSIKDAIAKDVNREVAAKGKFALGVDGVIKATVARKLSLASSIVNFIGNISMVPIDLGTKVGQRGASIVNKALGGEEYVKAGQVGAALRGHILGWQMGMKQFSNFFKESKPFLGGGLKTDVPMNMGAADFSLSSSSPIGKGLDILGKIDSIPGRGMQAGDGVAKMAFHTSDLYFNAHGLAVSEGKTGAALEKATANYIKNPPEALKEGAWNAAKYNTFNSDLSGLSASLETLRNKYTLSKVVVPFMSTLVKIADVSASITPATVARPAFWKNIAAGGIKRNEEIGRMMVGSGVGLTISLMREGNMLSGRPTGLVNGVEVDENGNPAYSLYVPGADVWIGYEKFAPVGTIMRVWSDTHDLIAGLSHPDDSNTREQVILNGLSSIGGAFFNSTYAEPASQFFGDMADLFSPNPNSEPRIDGIWKTIRGALADATVPARGILRNFTALTDDHFREAQGYIEEIMKGVPGLSSKLPIKYDAFGNPSEVPYMGIGKAVGIPLNPAPTVKYQQVLNKHGVRVDPPKYTQSFDKVDINLREHRELFSEMLKLSGELGNADYGFGADGKPIKLGEYLNQLVDSPDFNELSLGPNGEQEKEVQRVVSSYRKLAKEHMLENNDELKNLREQVMSEKEQIKQAVQNHWKGKQ